MNDLKENMSSDFTGELDPFESLSNEFLNIVERHAPQKSKVVRGNDAPFMTADYRREICHRSRLSKKARLDNTPQAKLAFHKQRNKCNKLRFEAKNNYFQRVTEDGGKRFWQATKPFISDKGTHGNEEYILEENGVLIKDPEEVSKIFIDFYTNIFGTLHR